jgi:pimeloyl-ACP methyl ester carboxylesterase
VIAAALVLGAAAAVAPLPHTRTGHGPAVVLVHGLGGDRHAWDDVAAKLAATHTVIAVDLPGHGAAPAEAHPDADRIARAIAATVDAEKAAPAVIVGHSLGGFIAAHVPVVAPASVRALVIVDIGIAGLWTADEVTEMKGKLATDREGTLRAWFGALSQPAQLERLLVGVRKLSNETLGGYMELMRDQPTAGDKLTLPTLLMASAFFVPGKKPVAEELAPFGFAGVKKLEVVRFTASKHWLFWDEPQKFDATLAQFLARVER